MVGVAAAASLWIGCSPGVGATETIRSSGSNTLIEVARAWGEAYAEENPGTVVAVSGGGSNAGIDGLVDGSVDVANASREISAEDRASIESRGVALHEDVVGHDALAIYVHKDNPVESLSLAQLASIYGVDSPVQRWSDLGIDVLPGHDEIVRLSRRAGSGTQAFFGEAILGRADGYRDGALELLGAKDVVDLVEKTPGAIGYSGLAYATDHVRIVPVRVSPDTDAVLPSIQTALDGRYPIARPLFVYTREKRSALVERYRAWLLEPTAQRLLLETGYAPAHAVD